MVGTLDEFRKQKIYEQIKKEVNTTGISTTTIWTATCYIDADHNLIIKKPLECHMEYNVFGMYKYGLYGPRGFRMYDIHESGIYMGDCEVMIADSKQEITNLYNAKLYGIYNAIVGNEDTIQIIKDSFFESDLLMEILSRSEV